MLRIYGCRGSRVGCFVIDAGGTPAITELLRSEREATISDTNFINPHELKQKSRD